MNKDLLIITALAFIVLIPALMIGNSHNKAMNDCMVEHSYDTCFYTLSR
jgi:hypothetical protein